MNTLRKRNIAVLILLAGLSSGMPNKAQTSSGSNIQTISYLNSSLSRSLDQWVYDNGLGDIVEEVQVGVTPSNGNLVVLHEYDQYRREVRKWNPVATSNSSAGAFVAPSSLSSTATSYYADNRPFSESVYDIFKPDQVASQYKPGAARLSNNKKVSTSYVLTGDIRFQYTGTGSLGITDSYTYVRTAMTDEDGRVSAVNANKVGRTLMTEEGSSKTAYVYDPKGNLVYVLPPLLTDYLTNQYRNSHVIGVTDSDAKMKQYAYCYRYDSLNRCIYKKLPGCDPVYYIYDKAGNCVLSQDGAQRAAGVWCYSIPDRFGRPCLTGTCTNTYSYSANPLHSSWVYAEYTGAANAQKGYVVNGITLSSPKLLTVNYYDTYSFIGINGVPSSLNYASEGIGQRDTSVGRGLQTGSAVACTKANAAVEYIYSATYYDNHHLPVQVRSTNFIGGINVLTTTYTYTGEPLNQRIRVTKGSSTGSTVLNAEYNNIYDFQHNNLLHHRVLKLKNASGTVVHMDTIQSLTYNDLGQVAQLRRGGHQADMSYQYDLLQGVVSGITSTNGFRQTLYRDRNTSQPLYNGSISSMEWQLPGEGVAHRYAYQYDGQNRLTTAIYAQLSGMSATSASSHVPAAASLLSLIPAAETSSVLQTNRYDETIGYDKHGNITSLQRRGMTNTRTFGLIDNLTFSYSGNQRTAVQDAASALTYSGASDFVNGANTTNEYTYNASGALTKDLNRGISAIQYDALGNVQKITFSNNRSIEYYYTADGTRHKAIHVQRLASGSFSRDTTDYVCGMILKGRHPESYQFDGGYASFSNDAYAGWHYYIQDYMGNNRMVVNRNGSTEQKTHYYPYGGVIGDISTNESLQKYKFEGKELDRSFGLDNYDIQARQYFAMAPTWDRVDPLAEKYYGISPYAYCGGDPVNRGDYDGMNPIYGISGNLLGVDELGLQGDAIIMDRDNYSLGMDHATAMKINLGLAALDSEDAKQAFELSYNSLSRRPDWDGQITLSEANKWYSSGSGDPLFVDASKVDLSSYVSLGDEFVGQKYTFNTLFTSKDGLVYGNLSFMRLEEDKVSIYPDKYDFDIKPWSVNSFVRNVATMIGSAVAGSGTPFDILFYGSNQLKRK